MPSFSLLGLPKLTHLGVTKALRLNGPTLLMVYLASKQDWVSRSELAFLFRPDDDEVSALKQVRLLIYRAKKYDWAAALEVDTKRVRFLIETDLQDFKQALKQQNWQQVSKLYTNPFLGDYSAADLPTYNAWLELERSDLHSAYQNALQHYARNLAAQANHGGASAVLADLVRLDPVDEALTQLYLKQLYLSGAANQALKVYANFSNLLKQEYDAEPLDATKILVEAIKNKKPLETQDKLNPSHTGVTQASLNALPKESTRFIGRQAELVSLKEQLKQENCRLLSLVGLGGSGKTRLALALAKLELASFQDGVCFVALAALSSDSSFITSLAQALGLTLGPKEEPLIQLIRFLESKEILIVLDNFEHLLASTSDVNKLLTSTENLKFIVTSRESLNLAAEWLFDVDGLNYPNTKHEDLLSFDAVTLFINSSKRVAPRLEFDDADLQLIAQICEQVQGLPLAIELAASWTRVMPVARIAKELSQGYDLLEASQTDLAQRHQNLKGILETTWAGLSEKKRQTLARFSVFQGGATLEAAEEVTGTHFSILLSLVNESLLRRIPPNRFDMHAVLKQFATEQLTEPAAILARHAATYSELAANNSPTSNSSTRSENFLQVLDDDLNNLFKAWQSSVDQNDTEQLSKLLSALEYLLYSTARYKQGSDFYAEALGILETTKMGSEKQRFIAGVHSARADLLMPLGEFRLAEQHLEKAIVLLEEQQAHTQKANILDSYARIQFFKGDFKKAKETLLNVRKLLQKVSDPRRETNAIHGLAIVMKYLGEYSEAEAYYYEALSIYKQLGDKVNIATTLNNLAALKISLEAFDEAKALLQDALLLTKDAGGVRMETLISYTLGGVHYKQAEYPEAEQQLLKALNLSELTQDVTLQADIYLELAKSQIKLHNLKNVKRYLSKSLKTVQETNSTPKLLDIMLAYAQFKLSQKQAKEALPYLEQVLTHEACQAFSLKEAQELQENLTSKALENPKQKELEPLAAQLLTTLMNHKEPSSS